VGNFSIKTILCLFILCFIYQIKSPFVLADAPSPMPKNKEVFSKNQKYVSEVSYDDQKIVVYENKSDKNRSKLWEMNEWSRGVSLSNDGQYVATLYGGSNLLPIDYKEDQVMLDIYNKGELVQIISLNEIISDFSSLERTVSHYYWGVFKGFDDKNNYIIETVEKKRIKIDSAKGIISREMIN